MMRGQSMPATPDRCVGDRKPSGSNQGREHRPIGFENRMFGKMTRLLISQTSNKGNANVHPELTEPRTSRRDQPLLRGFPTKQNVSNHAEIVRGRCCAVHRRRVS
jgi:hypothetical protein